MNPQEDPDALHKTLTMSLYARVDG